MCRSPGNRHAISPSPGAPAASVIATVSLVVNQPRDPEHPRDRPGTEPVTARSPLALRAVLAATAVVFCVVAAALVAVYDAGGSPTWLVTLLLVVAVLSAVDLAVVLRRLRRHDRG